jgi:hypothetical protein
MELLEGQDPEKKKLIEASDRHKRALEKEVSDLTQKTEKALTNALIIGGSLAITYFVISSLWGRKKKKKKHKKLKPAQSIAEGENGAGEFEPEPPAAPTIISEIGTKVLNHATVLLLDIAKEKLFEYLQRKKADENS